MLSEKYSDGTPNFNQLNWICLVCLQATKQEALKVIEQIKQGRNMDFGEDYSEQINQDIRHSNQSREILLDIMTTMEAKLEVKERLET